MQNLISAHFFAVLKEKPETGLLKVIGMNYIPATDENGNTVLSLNATAISEKTLGVVQVESTNLEVIYEGSDLDTFEEVRDYLSGQDNDSYSDQTEEEVSDDEVSDEESEETEGDDDEVVVTEDSTEVEPINGDALN